jgi:hypothetical protein
MVYIAPLKRWETAAYYMGKISTDDKYPMSISNSVGRALYLERSQNKRLNGLKKVL